MFILEAVGRALTIAGLMAWQILWPLGFTLSGVIQAIVRKERIVALLHDDFPHYLSIAAGRSTENLPSCQTKRPRTRLIVPTSKRLSTVKPTDRLPYSPPYSFPLCIYMGIITQEEPHIPLTIYTPRGYIRFVVSEVVCLG